jgi:hypothetical protein
MISSDGILLITESADDEAREIVSDLLASVPNLDFVNARVAARFNLAFEVLANRGAIVAATQNQLVIDAARQGHAQLEAENG